MMRTSFVFFATLVTASAFIEKHGGNSPAPDYTSFEDPNSIASDQFNDTSDFAQTSGDPDTSDTIPEELTLNVPIFNDQTDWTQDKTILAEAGNPDPKCASYTGPYTGPATRKLRKRGQPSFCIPRADPLINGAPDPPLPKIDPAQQKVINTKKQEDEEWDNQNNHPSWAEGESNKCKALPSDSTVPRRLPLCCWGPGFGAPYRVMWQANCYTNQLGRPACLSFKRRFCCHGIFLVSDRSSPVGNVGKDCVRMYPDAV